MSPPSDYSAHEREREVQRRRKHKNSRLGCPQCKLKRVKCDETLPSCKKCQARNTRCGYLDFPAKDLEAIRTLHQHIERYEKNPELLGQLPPEGVFQDTTPVVVYKSESSVRPLNQRKPTESSATKGASKSSLMGSVSSDGTSVPPTTAPTSISGLTQYFSEPQSQPVLPHSGLPSETTTKARPPTETVASPSGSVNTPSSLFSGESQDSNDSTVKTPKATAERYGTPLNFILNEPSPQSATDCSPQVSRTQSQKSLPSSAKAESTSCTNIPEKPISVTSRPTTTIPPISYKPTKKGFTTLLPLILHSVNAPTLENTDPEFFDETPYGVYLRLFLRKESHFYYDASLTDLDMFYTLILFGTGCLLPHIPQMHGFFFRIRGDVMHRVTEILSDVNDANAEKLMTMAACLTRTSINIRGLSMKEFITLSRGTSAVIATGMEKPELFPESIAPLRRFADGLMFMARTLYFPMYDASVLVEFLGMVKEFGSKYLLDEDLIDSDDVIHDEYEKLVQFLETCIILHKTEMSDKHVMKFPVHRLFDLLKQWFEIFPDKAFVVNSTMQAHEKVFYTIWYSLSSLLEAIFSGCRHAFTFSFNGYHEIYTLPLKAAQSGLSTELCYYSNYFCRIMAFLSRRRQYINRNTVMNDPIPEYKTIEERFKARAIDINESCITEFKKTIIKSYHYPSESMTIRSQNEGDTTNYYRGTATDTATEMEMFDLFGNLQHTDNRTRDAPNMENDGGVDLVTVDPHTRMCLKDYDPRFTDPIFKVPVPFYTATPTFLQRYLEDRKLILELDN